MISRDFFSRDPIVCARELIGATLIWGDCTGLVSETEAYTEFGDEASHTYSRPSTRAFIEAHQTGAAYVYLNYGIHWMLNVLVKGGSQNGFVLIRALQPLAGLEKMRVRRKQSDLRALCSGPGKLGQALGITGADHGVDLCADASRSFRLASSPVAVVADVRIGISRATDLPWRFLLEGSSFVSVPPRDGTASRRRK